MVVVRLLWSMNFVMAWSGVSDRVLWFRSPCISMDVVGVCAMMFVISV